MNRGDLWPRYIAPWTSDDAGKMMSFEDFVDASSTRPVEVDRVEEKNDSLRIEAPRYAEPLGRLDGSDVVQHF